jgi:DnaJ family protein C protein 17
MAPSDDLKSHAASSHDFYALLDISPAAADTEIRRAYRRTALKYHPDKIANPTPADIDKFHLLQIAYDVLSEPSVRQLYDNAREARERKKRENEMLEGVRRKMKEDLEAREKGGGLKRAWFPGGPGAEAVDREAEDKLEQEIRRLAEDGRRRRQAKEELMRREVLEEEERREREKEEKESAEQSTKPVSSQNGGGAGVLEIDRSVKVRWLREGAGLDFDKASLESLFSRFGKVESVFTLKDKRQRVGDKREKKTVATGVVVFSSIVGTHAAVDDSKRQQGGEWDVIQSVYWASGQEPEWASHRPSPTATPTQTPSTPQAATKRRNLNQFPGLDSRPSDSDARKETKKAPSFASFGKAATGSAGANSPSLEEITMIRLKNAERNKLKQDIQKEDEADLAGESVS